MLDTKYIKEFIKQYIRPKYTIALGTSKTSYKVLKELAITNLIQELDVGIIPTSVDIAELAKEFEIKIMPLNKRIDLTIEFADYADKHYNYIKNNTQSLIRDKLISKYSKNCFIFVDKENFNNNIPSIPLEVSRFGINLIQKELYNFGELTQRTSPLGTKIKTLESNYILDLKLNTKYFDFEDFDFKLKQLPGVLETGLFFDADKLFTVTKKEIKQELNKIR